MQAPRIIALSLLVLALSPAASPAAERCSGEDVAAIDQYCERIAAAEGPLFPETTTAPTLRTVFPAETRAEFDRAGPPGRALLAVPVAAPLDHDGRVKTAVLDKLTDPLSAPGEPIGTTARAVGASASEAIGLSAGFGWALLLSTFWLVGGAWLRRMR